MISFAAPLPVGNAVRILLAPPASAVRSRLLRKVSDDFSGYNDPNAAVIYEGTERSVLDVQALVNGTLYFYRAYDFDGAAWTAAPSVGVTPTATAEAFGPDILAILLDRLHAGLKVAVSSGALAHETGAIPVFTAPPLFESTRWPVVTVHMRSDAPADRAVGEAFLPDEFDAESNQWSSSEGWLARYQIEIQGWALNPDARIDLRKAIKKVLMANLPVFDAAGMVQVEFSQTDIEDFESYNAPVYQTVCSFSCLAPSLITSLTGIAVVDTTTAMTVTFY